MTLIQSILYGLLSGFSEFLPISSHAHQTIVMRLFGVENRDPIRDLLIHIAAILALLTGCKSVLLRLHRERRLAAHGKRGRTYASKGLYDLRLVRTASVPLMIGLLLYVSTSEWEHNLILTAVFCLTNGIILIIPEYLRQANKDASAMSGIDAIMIGICGALSAVSGISRIGAISAYATARGADKQYALNWALLLSIPALFLFCGFDILRLFSVQVSTLSFPNVLGYLFSALSAYCGSYFGIIFIRFLTVRTGYAGFAYYSWGTALFSLILYLIA